MRATDRPHAQDRSGEIAQARSFTHAAILRPQPTFDSTARYPAYRMSQRNP
jgi:hypothetical protein